MRSDEDPSTPEQNQSTMILTVQRIPMLTPRKILPDARIPLIDR